MNIEYVAKFKGYGGLNGYANNLQAGLTKFEDVKLITNSPIIMSGVPIYMKRVKSDLTHFTNQEIISPLITRKRKFIVTVHDLTVKKMKLFSKSGSKIPFLAKNMYDFKLSSLKNAKKIIAVSNSTKKDLIEELDIDKNKIRVIYEGVDCSFKSLNDVKKDKFKLLYVGNELPHKNLENLFKSIAIMKKTIPEIKLVKIGSPGWATSRNRLKKLAEQLKISDSILFKDEVQNIVKEYNSASAFVFPSLYEGFGLPILEAMACECPVITSNTSSIPEVAGDAASYFNPTNVDEMAEKIMKVLSDVNLRSKLKRAGLKRAKQFTWEKCAEQTREVYLDTSNC